MTRRKTKTQVPAPSAKTAFENKITPELMSPAALFGHSFRSESVVHNMQEQWMEAIQIKPGFWAVKTMLCDLETAKTDATARRTATDIIPHDHLVSLYDALTLMYEFESRQTELLCPDGRTKR